MSLFGGNIVELRDNEVQGKDCKYNHGGVRYLITNACVQCAIIASKKYNTAEVDGGGMTPEKKKHFTAIKKVWISKNKEHLAQYHKDYQATYMKSDIGKQKRREANLRYLAKKKLEQQSKET